MKASVVSAAAFAAAASASPLAAAASASTTASPFTNMTFGAGPVLNVTETPVATASASSTALAHLNFGAGPVLNVTASPVATATAAPGPVISISPVVPPPLLPSVPGVLFCESLISCIEELADVVSSCAAAAAGMGADIVQDVKCLVDAAESISKIPKACKGCLSL